MDRSDPNAAHLAAQQQADSALGSSTVQHDDVPRKSRPRGAGFFRSHIAPNRSRVSRFTHKGREVFGPPDARRYMFLSEDEGEESIVPGSDAHHVPHRTPELDSPLHSASFDDTNVKTCFPGSLELSTLSTLPIATDNQHQADASHNGFPTTSVTSPVMQSSDAPFREAHQGTRRWGDFFVYRNVQAAFHEMRTRFGRSRVTGPASTARESVCYEDMEAAPDGTSSPALSSASPSQVTQHRQRSLSSRPQVSSLVYAEEDDGSPAAPREPAVSNSEVVCDDSAEAPRLAPTNAVPVEEGVFMVPADEDSNAFGPSNDIPSNYDDTNTGFSRNPFLFFRSTNGTATPFIHPPFFARCSHWLRGTALPYVQGDVAAQTTSAPPVNGRDVESNISMPENTPDAHASSSSSAPATSNIWRRTRQGIVQRMQRTRERIPIAWTSLRRRAATYWSQQFYGLPDADRQATPTNVDDDPTYQQLIWCGGFVFGPMLFALGAFLYFLTPREMRKTRLWGLVNLIFATLSIGGLLLSSYNEPGTILTEHVDIFSPSQHGTENTFDVSSGLLQFLEQDNVWKTTPNIVWEFSTPSALNQWTSVSNSNSYKRIFLPLTASITAPASDEPSSFSQGRWVLAPDRTKTWQTTRNGLPSPLNGVLW